MLHHIKKADRDLDHWIGGAIKRPGAFTNKARRHHTTTGRYARRVLRRGSRASRLTKEQARLDLRLAGYARRRRRKARR